MVLGRGVGSGAGPAVPAQCTPGAPLPGALGCEGPSERGWVVRARGQWHVGPVVMQGVWGSSDGAVSPADAHSGSRCLTAASGETPPGPVCSTPPPATGRMGSVTSCSAAGTAPLTSLEPTRGPRDRKGWSSAGGCGQDCVGAGAASTVGRVMPGPGGPCAQTRATLKGACQGKAV